MDSTGGADRRSWAGASATLPAPGSEYTKSYPDPLDCLEPTSVSRMEVASRRRMRLLGTGCRKVQTWLVVARDVETMGVWYLASEEG